MDLIRVLIFGIVLCGCMYATVLYVWKDKEIPNFILKFKWLIFILIFTSLFLLEDYIGLLDDFNKNKIIFVVNFFISYTFIASINRKK